MQRTLVIHTGGIGDFLLACPAIARLHDEGPVDILGRPDRAALAVAGNIAECILDIDSVGFESIWSEPTSKLRDTLRSYDRAAVFMRDDDRQIHDGLQACGLDDVKCFPGLPPEDWIGHASAYYLECIGQPADASSFALSIPAKTLTHDIVIHPGSGGKNKNWPLEKFLAMADRLRKKSWEVTWLLGPAENNAPAFGQLREQELDPVLEMGSLVELASRLVGSRHYIGNDSGITHLAGAVGCPTIALFGPTDPARWAPLGKHVNVLRWAIGIEAIIENVQEFVGD